jgi:hypothetical protein
MDPGSRYARPGMDGGDEASPNSGDSLTPQKKKDQLSLAQYRD